MYAKGMTTRQISETIEDIYGFETSEGFISDVTDKIMPQIEDWQNRPLDEVYPILYIPSPINRKHISVLLLFLLASAFLQILLLRLFPALLLLYFLSGRWRWLRRSLVCCRCSGACCHRHCHYNSKHTPHHTLNSHNRFSSLKHVLFFLCFTIQYRCKNQCPK